MIKYVKKTWTDSRAIGHIACDICGKKNRNSIWYVKGTKKQQYVEVWLEIKNLKHKGRNCFENTFAYDICPKCFITKIIPLLEEKFGITPRLEKE